MTAKKLVALCCGEIVERKLSAVFFHYQTGKSWFVVHWQPCSLVFFLQ